MKFLIAVLLVTVTIAFADRNKDAEYSKACQQQIGVSKEAALALRQGKFDNPDPKIKCYTNCFFEKAGAIVNGKIQPDKVLARLGPVDGVDKVKKIQAKCDHLRGVDKCDTAYQLYKCYLQQTALL